MHACMIRHMLNSKYLISVAEVNCRPLRDPHNGMIQFNSTGLGSETTYVCNPGFRLAFGDRIRTCTINGYWSGIMPCCISKCWVVLPCIKWIRGMGVCMSVIEPFSKSVPVDLQNGPFLP